MQSKYNLYKTDEILGSCCSSNLLETSRSIGPLHYLMYEILAISLRDLLSRDDRKKREAIDWFNSENEDYCFSFRNLAEALGTSPDEIRSKVVSPAIGGNRSVVARVKKFAKVSKRSVLYLL